MDDPFDSTAPTDLTAPTMPAGRAIAWVAYRDGLGPFRLMPGEAGRTMRWGGLLPQPTRHLRMHDLVHDVRWVMARVRWRQRNAGRARRCPLLPLNPNARSRLRGIARKNSAGSAASLLETLKLDVMEARTALAQHSDRMAAAERALRHAAATGTLSAEGRCGWPPSGVRVALEAMKPAAWRDPLVRLAPHGWLWPLPSRGHDTSALPLFHEVQFSTAEILALWPAPPLPEPLPIEDLPASWTLMEAMVWIVLRNAEDVRDAVPETAREATSYLVEVTLPSGGREMVPTLGKPGFNRMHLTVEWAARQLEAARQTGPSPRQGERDLLSSLRAGKIIARGEPTAGSGFRPMAPDEWRGLVLIEQRSALAAEPEGVIGRKWHDVRLDRDEVVGRWPALGDPPAEKLHASEIPQSVPAPPPKKRGKGGHQTSPHVVAALQELGAKLAAEGPPIQGDGGKAELERWFTKFVEDRGGTISVGRARVHVGRVIDRHRAAIG